MQTDRRGFANIYEMLVVVVFVAVLFITAIWVNGEIRQFQQTRNFLVRAQLLLDQKVMVQKTEQLDNTEYSPRIKGEEAFLCSKVFDCQTDTDCTFTFYGSANEFGSGCYNQKNYQACLSSAENEIGQYIIDEKDPFNIKCECKNNICQQAEQQDFYVACGCGCCGLGNYDQTVCLYRSQGDDLQKYINEDKIAAQNPNCAYYGCAMGTLYKYCD